MVDETRFSPYLDIYGSVPEKNTEAEFYDGALEQRMMFFGRIMKKWRGLMLDIGCCFGYFRKLAPQAEYVGIDIGNFGSSVKGHFIQVDAEAKLPFRDEAFDNILTLEVYEHVYNREQLLTEIYRVLKTGGAAYLSVPKGVDPWQIITTDGWVCKIPVSEVLHGEFTHAQFDADLKASGYNWQHIGESGRMRFARVLK